MSFTRPGPMLRSLVRVAAEIRWREGWVGDVGGDVNARVGARWDSRVAMRVVGVAMGIVVVIVSFLLLVGGDRWEMDSDRRCRWLQDVGDEKGRDELKRYQTRRCPRFVREGGAHSVVRSCGLGW